MLPDTVTTMTQHATSLAIIGDNTIASQDRFEFAKVIAMPGTDNFRMSD